MKMIYHASMAAVVFAVITRLLVMNGFTVTFFCVLAALIGAILSVLINLDD